MKSSLTRWLNGNRIITVDFEFDANSRLQTSNVEASRGEIQKPSQTAAPKLTADQVGQLRSLIDPNTSSYGPSARITGLDGQQRAAQYFNGDMTAAYNAANEIYDSSFVSQLQWRNLERQN